MNMHNYYVQNETARTGEPLPFVGQEEDVIRAMRGHDMDYLRLSIPNFLDQLFKGDEVRVVRHVRKTRERPYQMPGSDTVTMIREPVGEPEVTVLARFKWMGHSFAELK